MCGITGILHTQGTPVNKEALHKFNEAQSHRGPDGAGLFVDGALGLGHRRLAILDLESGAQPQHNADGTVHITFNGEIYNYRELRADLIQRGHQFSTQSDTEVILHAYEQWGHECLQRLRGMFAFAIWDAKRRELFLARDRFGIKPLCYFNTPGLFAFASEIRSFRYLDGFRSTLDLQALDIYLHFQYIPAPLTIFQEVKKLPPAHYMLVSANGNTTGPSRYWDVEFQPDRSLNEKEWIERLDSALQETVQAHLVSDVSFGAFLSGGVDSGTVVGYMSQVLREPVNTFTVGFDDAAYDERASAKYAAERLGTRHHAELLDAEALGVLPTLVDHYGEPFGDSSAICAWHVSRVARKQVKMVLSGDGGDEIFGGYDYYRKMLRQHPEPQGAWPRSRRAVGNALRSVGLKNPLPSHRETWYNRSPFFDNPRRQALWRPEHQHLLSETRAWSDVQFEPVRDADLLSQCQYVDMHNYLPFDNLAKMDIASMCHGLEVRVPLLDHVFMQTVAKIPPELRVKLTESSAFSGSQAEDGSISKYLFKRTAERFFSAEYLNRKKLGFSAPVPAWLNNAKEGELRERLLSRESRLEDLFKREQIVSLLDEHQRSQIHGDRLWSLLFLAEWSKQNPLTVFPA